MNAYKQMIKEHLSENEPNYGDTNIHTLLELLYHCYTECNPIDNAAIRGHFADLEGILEKLTLAENDQVFYTICRICTETERMAFMEGLHVGLRLEAELSAEE